LFEFKRCIGECRRIIFHLYQGIDTGT
jgi:hypothetical protein